MQSYLTNAYAVICAGIAVLLQIVREAGNTALELSTNYSRAEVNNKYSRVKFLYTYRHSPSLFESLTFSQWQTENTHQELFPLLSS